MTIKINNVKNFLQGQYIVNNEALDETLSYLQYIFHREIPALYLALSRVWIFKHIDHIIIVQLRFPHNTRIQFQHLMIINFTRFCKSNIADVAYFLIRLPIY